MQLLEAIYCRTQIELGKECMRPNVGVAQGSIISPYLFNVYAEEMLIKLQEEGWGINQLYGFADDHLILSSSQSQLRRSVDVVEEWSAEYNIKLNSSKSGILEIPPKHRDSVMTIGTFFNGIPVVDIYKYLGVWLNQKLSPQKHLEYLFGVKGNKQENKEGKKGKINFLSNSLGPFF